MWGFVPDRFFGSITAISLTLTPRLFTASCTDNKHNYFGQGKELVMPAFLNRVEGSDSGWLGLSDQGCYRAVNTVFSDGVVTICARKQG